MLAACGEGETDTVTKTATRTVTTTETERVTVTREGPPTLRVFVPQPGRLVYKPDSIGLGAHTVIHKIRWSRYGDTTAVAKAVFLSNDCDPSCAGGTITPIDVTLKFKGLILCRGELVYDQLAIEGEGFDGSYSDQMSADAGC
jgi:hypothetical protein